MPMNIFYNPHQSVRGIESFSPSAGKPAALMQRLSGPAAPALDLGISGFKPIGREDLYRVHDREFVDAVFDGSAINGFGSTDVRVPTACLWTCGSMVAATLHAARRFQIALSPSSGFHHASYDQAGGYCTFNGLLVAADQFLRRHPKSTVGIIDCDVHYGNGTDDILRRNPQLARSVVHHTSGRHFYDDADPHEFFLWLEHAITDINRRDCAVVLYQAGADMHRDDPLGGFLDDAQMRQRDRTVFRKVRSGVAWNLAGGYRRDLHGSIEPVLRTHLATLQEAVEAARIRDGWERSGGAGR